MEMNFYRFFKLSLLLNLSVIVCIYFFEEYSAKSKWDHGYAILGLMLNIIFSLICHSVLFVVSIVRGKVLFSDVLVSSLICSGICSLFFIIDYLNGIDDYTVTSILSYAISFPINCYVVYRFVRDN